MRSMVSPAEDYGGGGRVGDKPIPKTRGASASSPKHFRVGPRIADLDVSGLEVRWLSALGVERRTPHLRRREAIRKRREHENLEKVPPHAAVDQPRIDVRCNARMGFAELAPVSPGVLVVCSV